MSWIVNKHNYLAGIPLLRKCKVVESRRKNSNIQRLSRSTGIPIRIQLALSGNGRSSHLGGWSCIRMSGLDLAMLYSCLQMSFSRTSHSSRQSSLGLGVRDCSSHRGNTKWQKEGMANWEHWSDKWVDVPIIVNAAGKEEETSVKSKSIWQMKHSAKHYYWFQALGRSLRQTIKTRGINKGHENRKPRLHRCLLQLFWQHHTKNSKHCMHMHTQKATNVSSLHL